MMEEKRAQTERRFVPTTTGPAKLIAVIGGLGAMLLGAGVYGQWMQEVSPEISPWLLGAGALLAALAAFLPDSESAPLRVGSAGVAVERGGDQPDRLAWCDVERIAVEGSAIVVHGAGGVRIVAGLPHHAAAAAWIVAEALDRIPSRVSVAAEDRAKLPRTSDVPGVKVAFEPVQVAGRRCKASGKLISFESDARLCPRCSEVYHRDQLGERCLTCEGAITV